MTTFYLVRHGQSEWNAHDNKYCGLSDIGLSELGKKQALQAGEYLQNVDFDAAYSSTLSRAYDTARLILQNREITVQQDARIVETDFGLWEGKKLEDFSKEYPDNWSHWLEDPYTTRAGLEGENGSEVYKRFRAFIDEKTEQHPNETILIVAHSLAIRFFVAGTLEIPFRNYRMIPQENTGITIYKNSDDDSRFHAINVNTHLQNLK